MTTVSAQAEIILPMVGMTGELKICTAPLFVFKKLPIVPESEINCYSWPMLTKENSGYRIYPNDEGESSLLPDCNSCRAPVLIDSKAMLKFKYYYEKSHGIDRHQRLTAILSAVQL